ncbi:hypothetical protein AVEN_109082-1 [Araneus ventricosus]|uniref:Uncharacterized protein n=1 Tax=Araneus ventricosus TaxID=182803 RepID=A0A4Y2SDU9_ARAVE|nr:hypothetical protein AVEN_109082-1 [Araneus ventricosus]
MTGRWVPPPIKVLTSFGRSRTITGLSIRAIAMVVIEATQMFDRAGVIQFYGLVMSEGVVRDWCEKFNTPSVTTDLRSTARRFSSGSGRRALSH